MSLSHSAIADPGTATPSPVAGQGAASLSHQELLIAAAQQFFRSTQVMRRIMAQARSARGAEELSLSDAQIHVLKLLAEEGLTAPRDLAARCAVSNPAMSKILNTLEAQDLITRRTDPTNRRSVQVALTPAGQQELGRVVQARIGFLASALDALTDAQLRDLITALGHLSTLVAAGDTE
jgi:DNA-binding MarR family transcriptional regulator